VIDNPTSVTIFFNIFSDENNHTTIKSVVTNIVNTIEGKGERIAEDVSIEACHSENGKVFAYQVYVLVKPFANRPSSMIFFGQVNKPTMSINETYHEAFMKALNILDRKRKISLITSSKTV
jgi:hypothetical protein